MAIYAAYYAYEKWPFTVVNQHLPTSGSGNAIKRSAANVTRVGDFFHFGKLFKAFCNN